MKKKWENIKDVVDRVLFCHSKKPYIGIEVTNSQKTGIVELPSCTWWRLMRKEVTFAPIKDKDQEKEEKMANFHKAGWGAIIFSLCVIICMWRSYFCPFRCCRNRPRPVRRPAVIEAEQAENTAAEERAPVLRPPRRGRNIEDALQTSTAKFLSTHSHLCSYDPQIT